MTFDDLHRVLFNAHILFSTALGVWAAVMAARGQSISGNFWGAVATSTILAAAVLVVGIVLTFTGYHVQRMLIYYLYMIWLVIIMPGLFTMMRGRDDRQAALAFAALALFNASTALSMIDRLIVGPWLPN
jgi:hypothetical protein